MINCHLSFISHSFRDIASRTRSKTTPPQVEPPDEGDFLRISESNLAGKEIRHWATFSDNCMILASVVLSRYTRVTDRRQIDDERRQTSYYDNSRTLHCNGRLKTRDTDPPYSRLRRSKFDKPLTDIITKWSM